MAMHIILKQLIQNEGKEMRRWRDRKAEAEQNIANGQRRLRQYLSQLENIDTHFCNESLTKSQAL